jgi:hypothetical protein
MPGSVASGTLCIYMKLIVRSCSNSKFPSNSIVACLTVKYNHYSPLSILSLRPDVFRTDESFL